MVTDTVSLTSAPSNVTVVATTGVGVLDSDGDGVADNEDACPLAGQDGPCGTLVKANGCPVEDVDSDGMCNDVDARRWSGDGRYGLKDNGCPLGDADGDTIPDTGGYLRIGRCTGRSGNHFGEA